MPPIPPLAVTGIIAAKGLSGNWLWLPVIGVHAAVCVFFAANWSRSGVVTDAELIAMRYSGHLAAVLRWCRATLQLLTNCVVLGWVLRAMGKIAAPFFLWERWLPGLLDWLAPLWPAGTVLGSPSEGLTLLVLLLVVGGYSSLGGLRGVVLTDLVQLALALFGSTWLAVCAWQAVGGRAGLLAGLSAQYGSGHHYLDAFPTPGAGWLGAVGMSAFVFGLYLVVQSYAYMAADGGGYFMQRLNAARSPRDAEKATLLFLAIHYLVRVWPWFVVGLAALVLIPLGREAEVFGGAAALVQDDREMAWPVLMAALLRPGLLGVVLASLLAAFMSTVDTHLNWGASYIVNDVWLVLRPGASAREQLLVARIAVLLLVAVAMGVSAHIDAIAQAWKWVAMLGASLGLPTLLRWLWWRVNAAGEIGAMLCGLCVGTLLALLTDLPYEVRLICISVASFVGLLGGVVLGPPTDPACLRRFVATVRPLGLWPGNPRGAAAQLRTLSTAVACWVALVAGALLLLHAGHQLLFGGRWVLALITTVVALGLLGVGVVPSAAQLQGDG